MMANPAAFALLNLLTGVGQGYVNQKETLRKEGLEDERTFGERQFRSNLFGQEQAAEDRRAKERREFDKGERTAQEAFAAGNREDQQAHEAAQSEKDRKAKEPSVKADLIRAQADLIRAQRPNDDNFNPHKYIADAVSEYMVKLATEGAYDAASVQQQGQIFGESLMNNFRSFGIIDSIPPPPGQADSLKTGDPAIDEAVKIARDLQVKKVIHSNIGLYSNEPSGYTNPLKTLRP
jgi:hypothetical protein